VGEGALYENLRLLTEQLNINPYVLFLGKRDDINKILKISDIFALSSLAEPFGLVNIEAMTARKPVVATNVGGIPEIVEDGENGFLVPPADEHKLSEKIISLLKDERLCRLMGEKGRKTVETKFSLDQMVNKYFSLIYSLQNA
jgi:glycosyltransferase involved in cell wall biosynthesis